MSGVTRRRGMALCLTVLMVGIAAAGCATNPTAPTDVSTELVQVTTADGVRLDGALWKPPAGSAARPGLLLVHGYAGNFYTGWPRLAEAIARQGYLTLALNMRDHDLTPQTSLFEDNRLDIEAGVKILSDRGASRIILVGQSLGTNRILYYQAETQDRRVRGLILMAGPGNLLEWNIRIFGPGRALSVLAEAQQRIREGRGADLMLVDLGPLGKALYSANHIVSLRGPDARSEPFLNIARVRVPILILHGTADRLADPAVAERLKTAAVDSSGVQVQMISGAGHGMTEWVDDILPILVAWLKALPK